MARLGEGEGDWGSNLRFETLDGDQPRVCFGEGDTDSRVATCLVLALGATLSLGTTCFFAGVLDEGFAALLPGDR